MNTEQLLREALGALEYHTAQTRPIERTNNVIMALRERLAQPAEGGEVWGWAIEDKHGVAQAIRPARKEFFGCVQSTEPFTAEDIVKMDREWAGIAPHHVVTLYTTPPASQEQAAQCGMSEVDLSDDDALRFACRVLEGYAPQQDRKDALSMLRAIRIRVRKTASQQPAQAEAVEPVAWRTFDGEGGYDYRDFKGNENYASEWERRNPRHKGWVTPLYTHPAPAQAVPDGWKLVPMEPPRHMMECAEALPAIDPNDLRLRRLGWTLGACQNRRRYLQMLNAAPNPDQKGSDA